MAITATENQLTRLLQISDRTIRENYKTAKISPGKYDLIKAIEIFVSSVKVANDRSELVESEKLYKLSQVALNDAKLKIIEKEYISVDEAVESVSTMLFNFKSKIMSLPKKIMLDLKKSKSAGEQEKIIEKHLKHAIGELKGYLEIKEKKDE